MGDQHGNEGQDPSLFISFVASPDQVDKIDALVTSHGAYMAKTRPRERSQALLSYDF